MSLITEDELLSRAIWARKRESPEWIAERIDVVLARLAPITGTEPWTQAGRRAWAGTLEEKAALVRSKRVKEEYGGDGYSISLWSGPAGRRATLRVSAGAGRFSLRGPMHSASLEVTGTRGRAIDVDSIVKAMVDVWAPLSADIATLPVRRLGKRGDWMVSHGYRKWLADDVATVTEVADGVTATRYANGTLISIPDNWEPQQAVDAMNTTRELNNIDLIPEHLRHVPEWQITKPHIPQPKPAIPDYRTQITGWFAQADGSIPVWQHPDPVTGEPVIYAARTLRPTGRVFLQPFEDHSETIDEDNEEQATAARAQLRVLAETQLRALPENATLEWHFADPQVAAVIKHFFTDLETNPQFTIRYTPRITTNQ